MLKMVADQIGGATWTRDAADALVDVLKVRATGLLHYATDGYASRYDVAQAVLQEAGVACELAPCRTSEFAAPAERPLNSRFNCARFDRLIGRARPPWRASLRSFIQTEGLADGPNP